MDIVSSASFFNFDRLRPSSPSSISFTFPVTPSNDRLIASSGMMIAAVEE